MYFAYLLAAILPAVILVLYAYKQDQFPEPPKIVFKTFVSEFFRTSANCNKCKIHKIKIK